MRSSWSNAHLAIVGAVILHVLAVCLYVLPVAWVPESVRVLSIAYVRPLFHQKWELFAPDPPLCSCEIEWSEDQIEWRSIEGGHYLERRMVQHLARYAQASLRSRIGTVDPLLIEAMRKAVDIEAGQGVAFRSKEECVTDVEAPADRETRITPLGS